MTIRPKVLWTRLKLWWQKLKLERPEHPLNPLRWITVRVNRYTEAPWWGGVCWEDLRRAQTVETLWGFNLVLRLFFGIWLRVTLAPRWMFRGEERVRYWQQRYEELWERADALEERIRILELPDFRQPTSAEREASRPIPHRGLIGNPET